MHVCSLWFAQANNFVRKKGLLPDNNDDDNDENDEEQAYQEPAVVFYGEDVYITFRKCRGVSVPILANCGWNKEFYPDCFSNGSFRTLSLSQLNSAGRSDT